MPLIATQLLMTNLCVLILCFDVSYVSLIMKRMHLGLSRGQALKDPTIIIK